MGEQWGLGHSRSGNAPSTEQRISFADCWITDRGAAGRTAGAGLRVGHHRAGVPQLRDRARGVRRSARRRRRLVLHRRHRARAPVAGPAPGRTGAHLHDDVLRSRARDRARRPAARPRRRRPGDRDADRGHRGARGRLLRPSGLRRWCSCTGPATRSTGPRSPRRPGSPRTASWRTPRTASAPSTREPRWAPGRWPASASTPRRTCRSARAGWSPPTTPTAPPGCGGPGCTG